MMNLPDDLNNIIDELKDAKDEEIEPESSCEEVFSDCPSESIGSILGHLKELMK